MNHLFLHVVKDAVKYWWVSLLIGLIAILLSIWMFTAPTTTLYTLSYVFAFSFIISGILETCFAISNKNILHDWGWTLAAGVLDFALGIILFSMPGPVLALILMYFVGFWIMLRSFWMIGESFELRHMGDTSWGWTLFMGIITLLCSFVFILSPGVSSVFVIAYVSASFFIYGIFRILLGFRLKSIHKKI